MAWTDNPYSYSGFSLATVLQNIEDNFEVIKENFSGPSQPTDPATGQLWFDTTTNLLKIRYGGTWVSIFNASTGALATSIVVATANIASLAVTEAKINTGAVTVNKIGVGAVTEGKIGTGAVTASKIGTGAVTEGKIGTGAVTVTKIPDNTITSAKMSTSLPDGTFKFFDAENTDYYYTWVVANGVITSSSRTFSPGGP